MLLGWQKLPRIKVENCWSSYTFSLNFRVIFARQILCDIFFGKRELTWFCILQLNLTSVSCYSILHHYRNSNTILSILAFQLGVWFKESVSLSIHNCPWVNSIQLTISYIQWTHFCLRGLRCRKMSQRSQVSQRSLNLDIVFYFVLIRPLKAELWAGKMPWSREN